MIESWEEEDDDGDPESPVHGDQLSWSCSINGVSLLPDSLWGFFTEQQLIFRASSKLHGHFGGKVAGHEGELERQGEAVPIMQQLVAGDGGGGEYDENGDGFSQLPGTLQVFFTDWQLIFRASSKPHGHFGREAADHEGELGQQGEAGQDGDSSGVFGGSLFLGSLLVPFIGWQLFFRSSSKPHGHFGRMAADQEGELGRWGEAVSVYGGVCMGAGVRG